ncbi:histidine kinase [Pseudoduganella buxea]|uniref:Histidine kinase n=2 Tax=Pseudoduganella buxea TaxID=1949069 RepID=A0ABQ1KJ12_9BURK|nr:histidine kinase [Pseudoduganella buxea]
MFCNFRLAALIFAPRVRCLAGLLLAFHLHCAAMPAAPLLSDYTHDAWGTLQSAPADVRKFAQGPDGWLWLATPTGLYRYDGFQFERTDTVHGHRLHSTNVLGLAATSDGALWVGYQLGGITVFRKDGARTYMESEGLPAGAVFHIEVARDGTVWVAARDGLAYLAPGARRFQRLAGNAGLPERRIYQILFARDGTQWIGSNGGAFFRRPGDTRYTQAWPRSELMALAEGPDGTIWGADGKNDYYRLRTTAPTAADPQRPILQGTGMHFDRQGNQWLMQNDGLERRQPDGAAHPEQRLTRQQGLSGPMPQTFFQDRENNIWIGTAAGLDRLRRNRIETLQVPHQLENPAIVPGPDQDVWVGSYADDVRSYAAGRAGAVVQRGRLSASHRAADGTLWTGNDRGLTRRAADGTVTTIAPPDGVAGLDPQAIVQDRAGALWVSFSGGGLFKLAQGRWLRDGGLSGFPHVLATSMALDSKGAVWLGHARNQVSLVDVDGTVRRFDERQGLRLGTVLHLGPDGDTMWAGGESGTALYRDGRFATLHGRGGETFRGVSGIVRLPGGALWLHGADGIFHIPTAEIQAWLADPAHAVDYERFDARDGLQGRAPQFRPLPSLLHGPDGQLWASTVSSVARLDPADIRRNPLPPPVAIRGVKVHGRDYPASEGAVLQLPQGTDSLEIAFTALSLSMPDRVRFRYRLEGVDPDWQEPSGRRAAHYTNLAPGSYRFRVSAANEDGVWNRQGASLALHIAPTFVQTPWFKLLLGVLAALLLSAAYVLRIRVIKRSMKARLAERLAERSRIARALHDTLLQSVQGLIMSFHAHVDLLPPGTRERARLDQTLNLADQLLIEGRDQILDLRAAASPEELGLALKEFGKGLAEHRPHRFEARVTGHVRPLQPRVHEEIYAIAREALFNASRYAQAKNIVLELEYGKRAFTLRVGDDGRGLAEAVAQARQRPGHWGLVGMSERAACIGADMHLASQLDQGTRIEVTLAGALAYAVEGGGRGGLLSRWWRRAA